jgi:flavin reductase (DIM6/NTAB) family NADH-FMN oxidoreductase RutF
MALAVEADSHSRNVIETSGAFAVNVFESGQREFVVNSMPSGDHVLFLAEVVEAGVNREGMPLPLKEAGFKYGG